MRRVRALIIGCITMFLIFAAIGCSVNPEKLLLGKWIDVKEKNLKNPNVIEFRKDGTIIMGIANVKYRVDSKTKIELFFGEKSAMIDFAVSENDLSIAFPGSQPDKYIRVNN